MLTSLIRCNWIFSRVFSTGCSPNNHTKLELAAVPEKEFLQNSTIY